MECPFCDHVNIDGVDVCEVCHNALTDVTRPAGFEAGIAEAIRCEPLSSLSPTPAVTISPNATVAEAVQVLAERNIGCILVVWANALLGIFSERDVLMRIGDRYEEVAREPIRHFMTPAPETLTAEDSIAFALNRMDINDFRHIPIEENERAVGVVSVRDVLAYVTQHFPELKVATN